MQPDFIERLLCSHPCSKPGLSQQCDEGGILPSCRYLSLISLLQNNLTFSELPVTLETRYDGLGQLSCWATLLVVQMNPDY